MDEKNEISKRGSAWSALNGFRRIEWLDGEARRRKNFTFGEGKIEMNGKALLGNETRRVSLASSWISRDLGGKKKLSSQRKPRHKAVWRENESIKWIDINFQ